MKKKVFLPDEVRSALDIIHKNGFEGYIVGGCVRDSLMGISPKDYDITTSALPEQTKQIFHEYRVLETGIKHGTVTVLINNYPLEITTYRIDAEYKDNRHPEFVTFTTKLEEDTARRDFTMNSIAYNDENGIVDFHGGENDINNKIIRCVGDPDKRFNEDALRIMRAIRFSSVLGFQIENHTKEAIFKNKELLRNISAERIASELIKTLCGNNVFNVLIEYIDVLGEVIPELLPMKGFEQNNIHHIYDVWEHTAKAVESIEPSPILRLSALFHDIGKPDSYIEKKGMGHFYGHANVSCEITKNILDRLKLDNYTKDTVTQIVKLHDFPIKDDRFAIKKFLNRYSPELFFMLLKMKRADDLAKNPIVFERLPTFDKIEQIGTEIIEEQACFSLKDLAVNGNDLIAEGFFPGKELGIILNQLLEEVIAEHLPNEKQQLLDYAKSIHK